MNRSILILYALLLSGCATPTPPKNVCAKWPLHTTRELLTEIQKQEFYWLDWPLVVLDENGARSTVQFFELADPGTSKAKAYLVIMKEGHKFPPYKP